MQGLGASTDMAGEWYDNVCHWNIKYICLRNSLLWWLNKIRKKGLSKANCSRYFSQTHNTFQEGKLPRKDFLTSKNGRNIRKRYRGEIPLYDGVDKIDVMCLEQTIKNIKRQTPLKIVLMRHALELFSALFDLFQPQPFFSAKISFQKSGHKQSSRSLSRLKLILSLGQGVCYHGWAMSSCWTCFMKECQSWFKPSPFIRHASWKEYHNAHFGP